jgi:hypothetical protein
VSRLMSSGFSFKKFRQRDRRCVTQRNITRRNNDRDGNEEI